MRYIQLFFILIFLSSTANGEDISLALFKSINERLSYMELVALYKAINHLPIEEIARENIVIDKAKVAAQAKGLDPVHIEVFFKA